ncbi:unnamed protein product [Lactuca saligna]|uniref:RPW8 domain-containing protein n=1 Tax=Lactuca saligna TaxID=75948 RepID=A0AA36A737_LACSI|nr:unnamed protein product [Lactuca saligna]
MAFLVDPLISESIAKLTDLRIKPIIEDVVNRNQKLDRTEDERKMFKEELEEAEELVKKCAKVKRNIFKKFKYSLKLKDFNGKLLRFFQIEVQVFQTRGIVETLSGVHDIKIKMDSIASDVKDIQLSKSWNGNYSSSMSTSSRTYRSGSENMEREKYGWRAPALPKGIVAFEEPLAKLKAEVVAGIGSDDYGDPMDCDDRSVLVVAAAGGCGKTTLVKMLCNDTEIREKFGENIFFVTVSETPNFMVIVNDLFNPNFSGPQVSFQSNEDAKNKLENFLNEKVVGPMLLVLDDVWSDTFIDNFPSKNRECKILVTSRTAFTNYDVFKFDPLNEKDAKTLFRQSAFTKGGKRPSPVISENLVNQMVTCCKRHPLTLSVVGRSLNGKDKSVWESMLKSLSHGRLVLDLHKDVLIGLERSFEALDDEFKECFLDLGLFPEDQRIPVSALLNMWVHLYKHDEGGVDTLAKIFELSYRNLVDLMISGFKNDLGERVNHCDQQFVTQHDLLRELAIHLNSKLSLEKRKRLIINARGDDFPSSIEQVQEPMQARILSISTGESFSSKWCDMEVPYLEVLILNLMSKTYTLPNFLAGNPKLKILNITNHGLYPTEFTNFNFLTSSHNLTRIRLERVDISPSILSLINLQKVSFIMCKIGNGFKKLSTRHQNIWPQLVEIEIDYSQDLVEFPETLCSSVYLKKISITNCNEMCGFNGEIGGLINLETLNLRSCTKLDKLPESMCRLENLSVLDISDCLSLSGLPEKMGKLRGLRTIYMKGCTGVHELPDSVEELSHIRVVCNEEISYKWQEYSNVEIDLVHEDPLETLKKIMPF